MALRRVAVSALGALVVIGLSACGAIPMGPPGDLALVSPYSGSSVADLLGSGSQLAKVRVCSVNGGPLSVDVHFDVPIEFSSTLSVQAHSIGLDPAGEEGLLIGQLYDGSRPFGADFHVESIRPLGPGECADVGIFTSNYNTRQGLPFTFTITW